MHSEALTPDLPERLEGWGCTPQQSMGDVLGSTAFHQPVSQYRAGFLIEIWSCKVEAGASYPACLHASHDAKSDCVNM